MSWTAKDIPDQTGRTAIVTGANSGLGLETAKALAGAGAHVVMAVRDVAKAEAVRRELIAFDPDASLEITPLDLGDQESIESAATAISAAHAAIDILVNNAGVMAMPEGETTDGFETQFGINHLGHWSFTAGLLPGLLRADGARVVTVTSIARHRSLGIDFDNPHLHGSYDPWKAYGQAKLANYYFGLGLQDRFEAARLSAQSLLAHPGLSNTNLQATTVNEGGGGWLASPSHEMAERIGMTPEQGARPQLRAATDPSANGGDLYGPLFSMTGPAVKLPIVRRIGMESSIDSLWALSATETGVSIDVTGVAAEL